MLSAGVVVLFVLNIFLGTVRIPIRDTLSILFGNIDERESWRFIVIESRLPQAITATLCGAALSVSGLMLQTAFRNPLAGPSIFGINSGAGLGVALVMLMFGGSMSAGSFTATGFAAILFAAFIGAMTVTGIIFFFSTWVRNSIMVLIIGIMIGYLASSAITLLNFLSFSQIPVFSIITLLGLIASITLIKPLNALLLGEEYAENLGINTRRVRNWLLVVTGLLTAITTAFCGPIAFIGLAVPHIARLLLGTENHRFLMPATLLSGAAMALICNLVCYMPGTSGVIPLNAVTPLLGAPVIIYVIAKNK